MTLDGAKLHLCVINIARKPINHNRVDLGINYIFNFSGHSGESSR